MASSLNDEPVVIVKNLSVKFGEIEVLKDINFKVYKKILWE